MKKNVMFLIVSIIIGTSQFLSFSFASGKSWVEIEEMGIAELVELLNHPDWGERCKAIDGLSKFREKDEKGFPRRFKKEFEGKEEVSIALIRLLERENLRSEEWWQKWWEESEKIGKEPPLDWNPEGWEKRGEGRGEYYIELVDAVICLYDERAIRALVGTVECGNNPVKAVVEFRELAIQPLLERLEKTKDDTAKSAIIGVLGDIMKKTQIIPQVIEGTPTTKASLKSPALSQTELMKETFIKNLNDPYEFVRMSAIQSLGILGDPSVIPLLKPIAKNDPCVWNTVSGDPAKFIYPVRDEAQRVIKLLEEKKKQQEEQANVK